MQVSGKMVSNMLARRADQTSDTISHPPLGCDLQGTITLWDCNTLVTLPAPDISSLKHWELFLFFLLLPT